MNSPSPARITNSSRHGAFCLRFGLLGWAGFILVIIFAAFICSGLGTFKTSYDSVLRLWLRPFVPGLAAGIGDTASYIVLHVRLARICLALLVGGALAVAGAVYQGVLLNPLADPFTLGISTGAAFGASLAILFGAGGVHFLGMSTLPAAAFLGRSLRSIRSIFSAAWKDA